MMMMDFEMENKTSKEILFDFLSGLWKENELSPPKNIMMCFDETEADKVVTYIDRFLDTVEYDSFRGVIEFLRTLMDGRGLVPREVSECITTNKEWADLKIKYGITEHTKIRRYYAHVLTYTVRHLREVRDGFDPVKEHWDKDNYY